MDWKAQAANLKEVGGIIGGMLKETDWKGVAKAMGNEWKAFGKRAKMEAGLFAQAAEGQHEDDERGTPRLAHQR